MDETWFQAGLREAEQYDMESEYTDAYCENIENGLSDKDAAFNALWDWDLLDYEED